MKDRVSGAPGQYQATILPGELQKMQAGEPFAITMVRDDKPIVEGTPFSKATILPDDVAKAICPNIEDPTPADAFNFLAFGTYPAVEHPDHPGCYYRIVDGVTEWLNPPMQWGVEYRTAERHSGKPVYVKWFDIGSLPNNTYKQFSPGLGNATVVSMQGFYNAADYTFPIPKISNGGYVEIWYYIRSQGSNPYIQVYTKYDFSSATATFLLKYIK